MSASSPQDSAVSSVMGTVLVVALTVVFVAVVAAVGLGFSNGMFEGKAVGLTLTPYSLQGEVERGVSVTIHGGADAGDIQSLRAMVEGATVYYQSPSTPSVTNPIVGTPYRFMISNNDFEELKNKLVTVVAQFSDGKEAIILQKAINLPQTQVLYPVMPYTYVQYRDDKGNPDPGHGFSLKILGTLGQEIIQNVSKYTVNMTANGQVIELLKRKNEDTFYIQPVDNQHPYSTAWQDGELTGTIEIYATPKSGKTLLGVDGNSYDSGKVLISRSVRTIDAREGIYEDLDVGYTLTATKKPNTDVYTLSSTGGNSESYAQLCYVVKTKDGSVIDQYSFSNQKLENNGITWGGKAKLDNYINGEVVEVYVRKTVNTDNGNTFAWHKIYDTPIQDLKK